MIEPTDTLPDETPPEVKRPASWLPLVCWLTCVAGFAAFAGLARVTTHLGEKAYFFDRIGSDYVWRVWWRGLNSMIDVRYPALLYAGLIAGCLVFVVAIAYALWLAFEVGNPGSGAAPDRG